MFRLGWGAKKTKQAVTMMYKPKFSMLLAGFSEVESKATTSSEANRKIKAKGFTVDSTRANIANLRPQKPLQKKGKLFSLINSCNFSN